MFPFRKILFAVDFSPACDAIVPHVAEMVRHSNAELILVHAFEPVSVMYSDPANLVEFYPVFRKAVGDRIEKFAKENFHGITVETIIKEGEAAEVVTAALKSHGADLIMMPTHGHGSFRKFLLGSVTAKVLHDVSCAVWTGIHDDPKPPAIPYRSIVCTISSASEESRAVIMAADSLAKSYRAKLTLVHVVEVANAAWEVTMSEYRQEMIEAGEKMLAKLKQEMNLDADLRVSEDMVSPGVSKIAKEVEADLMIVGRGHSQDWMARFTSRLYSIVRDAPCPVLSI